MNFWYMLCIGRFYLGMNLWIIVVNENALLSMMHSMRANKILVNGSNAFQE